jgi:tetratricopeptide (TPR) repeat protein
MKSKTRALFSMMVLAIGFTVCAPFVASKNFGVCAQNRISGYVSGVNRQRMGELNVELMDDYNRTVARTRTNGSGYYEFARMPEGNYTIKVYTYGTDYEEQEKRIQIENVTSTDSNGNTRTGGYVAEWLDFTLKLNRGVTPANVVVFVQDVPPNAKKLYDKAIDDLDNKRNTEALAELRQAIEIFPKYFAALDRLGTEYINLASPEAFQAAEVLLRVAVEVQPRAYETWYGLAYSRYSLKNFADALTAVQKAIELNANSAKSMFLSGVLMKKTKKFAEAEKQLLKAKELSKDTIARVHWELATLYGNEMNRYSDAAKELRLFLKAQPGSKDAENIKKLIADFEAKAQKT